MKRRRSESDREDASESTRRKGRQQETSNSNARTDPVATLHRAVGNQAVRRLHGNDGSDRTTGESARGETGEPTKGRSTGSTIQPKPAVDDANDRDGREADRAADPGVAQTNPVVGTPGDRYEQEAEAVARSLTAGRPVPAISRIDAGDLDAAQRQDDGASGRERRGETSAAGGSSGDGSMRDVAAHAITTSGAGRPMHRGTRRTIERGLGADLGGVRVHDGPEARSAAASLGARAFTHGRDIWLGPGASDRDLSLMAHESTHVVQQGYQNSAGSERARSTRNTSDERVQRSIFGDAASAVKEAAKSAVEGAKEAGKSAVEGAKRAVETIAEGARDAGERAWNILKSGGERVWNLLKNSQEHLVKLLQSGGQRVWNLLKGGGQRLWNVLQNSGRRVWNLLRRSGDRLWDLLGNSQELLVKFIQSSRQQVWNALKGGGQRLWTVLRSSGQRIWKVLRSRGQRFWDLLRNDPELLVKFLQSSSERVWNVLKGSGQRLWNVLQNSGQRVWSVLQRRKDRFLDLLEARRDLLVRFLQSRAQRVWNVLKGRGQQFLAVLQRSGQQVWSVLQNRGRRLWEVLKGSGQRIWSTIQNAPELLWNLLQSGGSWVWNLLKRGQERLWEFITQAPPRLVRLLEYLRQGAAGMQAWFQRGLQRLLSDPATLGKWFVKGLRSGAAWTKRLLAKLRTLASPGVVLNVLLQSIKAHTRPLTSGERTEAKKVFKGSIDYGLVRVDEDALIAAIGQEIQDASGMAVTTFHTINFTESPDMTWMVHELTHVAQYEAVGSQYILESIHAQTVGAGYSYDKKKVQNQPLSSFNREQQAAIIEDYYAHVLYDKKDHRPEVTGVDGSKKAFIENHKDAYERHVDALRSGDL